jgi:superfamily I DNA and/or RNA helicase
MGFLYLVGDTKQLSAVVSDAGRPLAHGRSMMERLGALGVAVEHLTEQRRMDPQMLDFPNRAFYNGALRTAADRTPDPCGGAARAPYAVVQVTGAERRVGTSYCNHKEAAVAVALAQAMQRRRGEDRVHILVPYTAALKAVNDIGSGVRVSTIDSFQGKESDAVILCVTRVGREGFWSDARRLVVALTRARYELLVIGDFASFHGDPSSSLGALADDARGRGMMWTEAEAVARAE